MQTHPILERIAIGYSPIIDVQRNVMATRLTVFPLKPDVALDCADLLATVAGVWSGDARRVSLNVASEPLLRDLMASQPSTNVMVEVPAFIAAEEASIQPLLELRRRGNTLLLKGRPVNPLPREVLPCFRYSMVDVSEDRRSSAVPSTPGVVRTMEFVQSGVNTVEEVEASFRRGAKAVLGWPIEYADASVARKAVPSGIHTVVDLIQKVDREESVERIEAVLKTDPTLAFRLMRYINSPAFGLAVEISSFRHAIMMLGYARLKRWLALLLVTATDSAALRPMMFAAVRRGLIMEELVRSHGDETQRSELFICGVFSLLDRMLGQPFRELFESIPVHERVRDALVDGHGAYAPYLELVAAIEQASMFDLRAVSEALLLAPADVNRAVLTALGSGQQIS
jgi:c-di-GMP phosphodiesterase